MEAFTDAVRLRALGLGADEREPEACTGMGSLVNARGGPEIDELGKHVGEVGLRIDAVQFAGLDERRDAGPVFRTLIVTGEECILAIEYNGTDASFDDVGVELDAAII